jgi:hypothetical protein
MSLTIPLALAPSLEVTIPAAMPTISENDQADRVADVEPARPGTEPSGSPR